MNAEHAINGRIGALESWARTENRTLRTQNGHKASPASVDYWFDRVDPEGVMSHDDRVKAAENARSAHMLRLAQRSAAARRAKKSA